MNTCWAVDSWAVDSWAANTWAALGSLMETLAAGDLTTAFSAWLAGVSPDVNTSIRDRLTAHYAMTPPQDATTLLARFLQNRS